MDPTPGVINFEHHIISGEDEACERLAASAECLPGHCFSNAYRSKISDPGTGRNILKHNLHAANVGFSRTAAAVPKFLHS